MEQKTEQKTGQHIMRLLHHGLLLWALLFSIDVWAGENHQRGKVYDITSTTYGLLIRLEGNVVPTQCPNPNGWGWMVIPEANKTMVSVALTMFTQKRALATVYTNGTSHGFCKVIQYHPHN